MGVVIPIREDEALTKERLDAYFVALELHPELRDAAPLVRDTYIDRVILGRRKAEHPPAAELNDVVALLRHDAAQRADRIRRAGW